MENNKTYHDKAIEPLKRPENYQDNNLIDWLNFCDEAYRGITELKKKLKESEVIE